MNQKMNVINDNNNVKNTNNKQFDENDKKCDDEDEIIAPLISDKKNKSLEVLSHESEITVESKSIHTSNMVKSVGSFMQ